MNSSTQVPASLRALLSDLVDYAGLFPPAGLDMKTAVENYARYLLGEDAWALGRFILPVARFEEFEDVISHIDFPETWCISALIGTEPEANMRAIGQFNAKNTNKADVDTIEVKAESGEAIRRIAALVPKPIATYFEIPTPSAEELLPVIREVGCRAKIRTGGVTQETFPPPDVVTRFLLQVAEHGVPFKATAGLHHPLRCTKPLTYEAGAISGLMHGFLNIFLAATLAKRGAAEAELLAMIEQCEVTGLRFHDAAVHWHGHSIGTEVIEECRQQFAISFGSCSFEEPMNDLRELKFL